MENRLKAQQLGLFRELSLCGVVEEGSDPIASLPASLLAREGNGPLDGRGGVPSPDFTVFASA